MQVSDDLDYKHLCALPSTIHGQDQHGTGPTRRCRFDRAMHASAAHGASSRPAIVYSEDLRGLSASSP